MDRSIPLDASVTSSPDMVATRKIAGNETPVVQSEARHCITVVNRVICFCYAFRAKTDVYVIESRNVIVSKHEKHAFISEVKFTSRDKCRVRSEYPGYGDVLVGRGYRGFPQFLY
jgi:hypothetical protein